VPRFRRPRHPVHTLRRVLSGLLTVAALVLALRSPPKSGPPGPPTVPVVVAAADLSPGVVLDRGDLAVVRLPADAAPAGRSADPHGLLGRVLAAGVRAREPLTDARVVGAGLAARLPPGQVAAPVRLADLAVAQLVSPGDRVDVLATAPDAARAELVTAGALVLAAPARTGSAGEEAGVLLVAVDPATAARLAAASTTSTVTVSLAPS
jgi:Flp pilus assembly protein CpaB